MDTASRPRRHLILVGVLGILIGVVLLLNTFAVLRF
jgi:hypothetical protein